jgi:hypothetical protein
MVALMVGLMKGFRFGLSLWRWYSGDVVEATSGEYAQDVISGLCRGELAYMVIGAQGPMFSLLRFVLV